MGSVFGIRIFGGEALGRPHVWWMGTALVSEERMPRYVCEQTDKLMSWEWKE